MTIFFCCPSATDKPLRLTYIRQIGVVSPTISTNFILMQILLVYSAYPKIALWWLAHSA